MAHTTIINGTIYEKSKGKDLAGGTVYEKDHGKTLVGGTVYEVGFAKPMAMLAIGYFPDNYFSISVDGVVYNDTILTVPVGTVVEIKVFDIRSDCKHHESTVSFYINDNYDMGNDGNTTYSYTVMGNTTLSYDMMYGTCHDCYRYYYSYNVYITEAPEDSVLLTIQGSGGTVTIDGTTYAYERVFVPIGTIVTLDNRSYSYKDKESYIRVNGITVLDGCGSYDYIATVNATINNSSSRTDDDRYYYYIDVIEEI